MTDPVADFLTRLRNANSAFHEEITLPYSKMKASIAEILKTEGYIQAVKVVDGEVGKALQVELKYGPTVSVRSRESSVYQSQDFAFMQSQLRSLVFSVV